MLNREPMGMKLRRHPILTASSHGVSVLNREPMGMKPFATYTVPGRVALFQCSTASRWG